MSNQSPEKRSRSRNAILLTTLALSAGALAVDTKTTWLTGGNQPTPTPLEFTLPAPDLAQVYAKNIDEPILPDSGLTHINTNNDNTMVPIKVTNDNLATLEHPSTPPTRAELRVRLNHCLVVSVYNNTPVIDDPICEVVQAELQHTP